LPFSYRGAKRSAHWLLFFAQAATVLWQDGRVGFNRAFLA